MTASNFARAFLRNCPDLARRMMKDEHAELSRLFDECWKEAQRAAGK